ncbi:MAG: phospholipid carrier-dependent glycosyltransferase [Planctomycetota bacterium]|nr:MAG: phospholipid carrier-dependent glycosyltransferase [Planctomycetota bacterium]
MTTQTTTEPPTPRLRAPRWPALTLSLLSVPIIFWGLGSASLGHGDEGFYQLVARHMLESGDFTRLEFTGEHRIYDTLLNAPIHYWAKAGLIWAFGDNYWTMRILSALFGLLTVLATYRLTARVAHHTAGFVAGLLLLTTYQFIHYHGARVGVLEPLVAFCLVMIADSFLRAVERGRGFVGHNVYLIALVNLKSPLLIVPVFAELFYFAITPAARRRFVRWALTGLAMLPLGFVWHGYQYFKLGHEQFGEAVAKMTGKASGETVPREDVGVAHHARYYGQTMLFGAFPTILLVPAALPGLLAVRRRCTRPNSLRMLWLMPGCLLAFFLVVSKYYSWYMIPLYPFLCALVAVWLDETRRATRTTPLIAVAAGFVALVCVLQPDIFDLNPYATRRMDVHVMTIGSLSPWVAFAGAVALSAIGLAIARRAMGSRFAPGLAWAMTVVLVGYGGVRVLAPQRFIGYQSPMAELRRQIDADLAAGRKLEFPIPITEAGNPKVRYYFGNDFVIRKVDRDGVFYELVDFGQTPMNPTRSAMYYRPRAELPDRQRLRQRNATTQQGDESREPPRRRERGEP